MTGKFMWTNYVLSFWYHNGLFCLVEKPKPAITYRVIVCNAGSNKGHRSSDRIKFIQLFEIRSH
ncbi:unnamed protein product [Prunus brigantina]